MPQVYVTNTVVTYGALPTTAHHQCHALKGVALVCQKHRALGGQEAMHCYLCIFLALAPSTVLNVLQP